MYIRCSSVLAYWGSEPITLGHQVTDRNSDVSLDLLLPPRRNQNHAPEIDTLDHLMISIILAPIPHGQLMLSRDNIEHAF
jgi:hypothetical protein